MEGVSAPSQDVWELLTAWEAEALRATAVLHDRDADELLQEMLYLFTSPVAGETSAPVTIAISATGPSTVEMPAVELPFPVAVEPQAPITDAFGVPQDTVQILIPKEQQ